jgi:hypothetical protein
LRRRVSSRGWALQGQQGQDSNGYDLSGLAAKLEAIGPEFAKVSEMNKNRRRKVEAAKA